MTKTKTIRGSQEELGVFYPKADEIHLYVDVIRKEARRYGCTYRELKTLVMLHERAHVLFRDNRIRFPGSTKGERDYAEEVAADAYAFRQFRKQEGRWPALSWGRWRTDKEEVMQDANAA